MSDTTTLPKVGDRVRAVCIPHITHDGQHSTDPALDRRIIETMEFTVSIVRPDNTPPRVYGEFRSTRRGTNRVIPETWYVTEWEPITKPLPAVGDKVYPLADDDGSWLAIPEFYHDKVGTVRSASIGAGGRHTISAEFQSQQKPDDTISWSFYNWKPAPADEEPITFATKERMVGKSVKVIYASDYSDMVGKVGKVTKVYPHREEANHRGPKVDGITVMTDLGHPWVQAYEVVEEWVPAVGDKVIARKPNINLSGGPDFPGEVMSVSQQGDQTWYMVKGDFNRYGINFREVVKIEDTTVPEYTPSVGERVRFTGCLTEAGIEDGFEREGTITAVTDNIWEIDGILGGKYVSGPGYVFPFPVTEPEPEPYTPIADGIAARQEEIDRMTRELQQARDNNAILMKSVEDWTHDFDYLAEAIKDEAVERDWCEEYERVMGRIEGSLRVGSIPERTTPRVRVRRRVQASVYKDVWVWVSEDDQYTTDTDEMYEEQDSEDPVGDEWPSEVCQTELENNGFDESEVRTL